MLSSEEYKKYNKLDECLKFINKNFITLTDADRASYSKTFVDILQIIHRKMCEVDTMYANCAGAKLIAGSSFDRIKVGKPDEFDMNLEIKLPAAWRNTDDVVVTNASPSYVTINIKKGLDRFAKDEVFKQKYYKGITNWMDADGYLIQDKFHSWMESVVIKALNTFPSDGTYSILDRRYKVCTKKSGPAVTLNIHKISEPNHRIDVDLVPVIQFNTSPNGREIWPNLPVRQRPMECQDRKWCAVPKPKKNSALKGNREWRISFAQQERELLHERGHLKSTIRQLKKLKATHEETKKLASYYVKTIFLWELHDGDNSIWCKYSNAALFMFMLKKLYTYLDNKRLFFYWDKRNNLLDAYGSAVDNMKFKLCRIIKEIDANINTNPRILAQFLLTSQELVNFNKWYGTTYNIVNNLSKLKLDGESLSYKSKTNENDFETDDLDLEYDLCVDHDMYNDSNLYYKQNSGNGCILQ